MLDMIIYMQGI